MRVVAAGLCGLTYYLMMVTYVSTLICFFSKTFDTPHAGLVGATHLTIYRALLVYRVPLACHSVDTMKRLFIVKLEIVTPYP